MNYQDKRISAMTIWNGHYNKKYFRKYPIKGGIVRWIYLLLQKITHKNYMSYMPDKCAIAINAFSTKWNYKLHFAFPPFSIIWESTTKDVLGQGRVDSSGHSISKSIMVSSITTANQWTELCVFKNKTNSISTRNSKEIQANHNVTGAFRLSENAWSVQDYQKQLQTSSCSRGDQQLQNNTIVISKDGCNFVTKNRLIKLHPSLDEISDFLLHDESLSYSAINTVKSMLSSVFEVVHKRGIGKEVLIKRFMKGIFHIFPKQTSHGMLKW